MKPLIIAIIAFISLGLLVWMGLKVKPAPFSPLQQTPSMLAYVPLPCCLPAPVKRFYQVTYGDQIPVIYTAVISGRGTMRFLNLPVPLRFRFTHEVGQNFRHDIHLTFFGFAWMKGYEHFREGHGWANTPGENEGPGFDQGSNVSLWAETLNWFPAVLLTDSRVKWEEVDDSTARLVVPFGNKTDTMTVRFNPADGLVANIQAMKY